MLSQNTVTMSLIHEVRRLREMRPEISIIIIASDSNPKNVLNVIAAGIRGYLVAPVNSSQLRSALHNILIGGAALSPSIALIVIQSLWRNTTSTEKLLLILSQREQEVTQLLLQGMTYKEIASCLSIERGTVQRHIHSIYAKLNIRNRAQLAYLFHSG